MKIEDYLNSKKIIVNENGFVKKQYAKNYNDIDRQIQIIVNCQQLIIGEKSTIIPRVNSFIGKEFEGYKVDLKKVKEIMPELQKRKAIIMNIDILFLKKQKELWIERKEQ